MSNAAKVVVYIRAADAKQLRAEGKDPALWVRQLVEHALAQRRDSERVRGTDQGV